MRCTLIFILAMAGTASAQPKKRPTQHEIDAARAHFRDAEAAKARGDFQTAAVEYLAAYELFQEPEFFFNVADVYRLAGDEANALAYYDRYLELDPHGRGAQAARTAADSLRRSIAAKQDAEHKVAEDAQRRAAADAQHTTVTQPQDKPATQRTTPLKANDDADLDVEADVERAVQSDAGRGLRIAGLASAGAGVIGLGVGVAFWLRAHSIANEASHWTTFDSHRYDQGLAAERDMFAFTAIGWAAVIAGGVLYHFGHRATIVPAVDKSSIALTAEGRF